MAHPYKELFWQINKMRKIRGLPRLSWKEFLAKEEGKPARIPKPDPKPLQRPPAVYDNHSAREKYGL
jgi:hypothetical protein